MSVPFFEIKYGFQETGVTLERSFFLTCNYQLHVGAARLIGLPCFLSGQTRHSCVQSRGPSTRALSAWLSVCSRIMLWKHPDMNLQSGAFKPKKGFAWGRIPRWREREHSEVASAKVLACSEGSWLTDYFPTPNGFECVDCLVSCSAINIRY